MSAKVLRPTARLSALYLLLVALVAGCLGAEEDGWRLDTIFGAVITALEKEKIPIEKVAGVAGPDGCWPPRRTARKSPGDWGCWNRRSEEIHDPA